MIKVAVTPEVNAISTLLMLLTLVMIIIAAKLESRTPSGEVETVREESQK
jgi:spermidine/putrescine transport system permease protein